MNTFKDTAMISYKNDSWVVGDQKYNYGDFFDTYQHYVPYYPSYPTVINNLQVVKPNPTEAAFNIVTKLIEKGFLKNVTVKQFTALVKEVAETLA